MAFSFTAFGIALAVLCTLGAWVVLIIRLNDYLETRLSIGQASLLTSAIAVGLPLCVFAGLVEGARP